MGGPDRQRVTTTRLFFEGENTRQGKRVDHKTKAGQRNAK
jgi:hypothetical protein